MINTAETREYIEVVGARLQSWTKETNWKTVVCYTHFDFWFVLPRTNCDCHNYFKVLCDTLEAGGIVANDKYVLPRVQGVGWDTKKPEIIVGLDAAKGTSWV